MSLRAVVYGRPTCVACRHVKRFLTKAEIMFTEQDADSHRDFIMAKVKELDLDESLPFVEVHADEQPHYMTGNRSGDLEALAFLAKDQEVAS
ncbi:Glutaredoxin [Corynebacterium kalinowskii]|uniref:Glutaredoxin n=1 Tax=Corynebacterium kalinowskii TaxID=2675216 RepID=A0A6B8VWN8_9CORY|nr:glutaredoxin domain-containing protein [Corynebacterium kalinowskii]QGU03126.1 Glutaredoxin [Corynebacterium kalinowskii]